MFKRQIKNNSFWALLLVVGLSSCEDYVDLQPEEVLVEDQMYQDVFDADAAVIGIYGSFMQLAEKYVILNELRADLMATTRNSTPEMIALSEHNVQPGNTYANPKDFYEVIQKCNDALSNFDIMLAERKLSQTEYNMRYADIGTLRSWIYLQLGIHYGEIPYITEPITNINDVRDLNSYPRIPLDELIDELVAFTENLSYTSPYTDTSTLAINVDGYNTAKFFINKECLLGDLQLWNNNYLEAASHYKTVMETSTGSGNISELYDTYRLKGAEVSTNNDLAVGYIRFREQDSRSLIDNNSQGWRSIFAREQDALWNIEWIWSLPFDTNFSPENPFIELFANRGGDYMLQPSASAITLWDSQTQRNGFMYDARGRKFSYKIIDGEPVIMKYLYDYYGEEDYMPIDLFQRDGDWFLYRAARLHLRYAEAANRDNKHRLADALVNFGINNAYTVAGVTDKTNIEQTNLPFPYNFDARNGDFPRFRADWHRNVGIRGRAFVQRAEVIGDSLIAIEDNIIEEAALELAYEGNRWDDLVRVARRRNDPAFLADRVYQKFARAGNANAFAIRTKLMDMENWYLPFDWEEDEQ